MIAPGFRVTELPVRDEAYSAPATIAPRAAGWRPLRLAYLTTQYPKVSHTFIRREICELERRGHSVLRLAIRAPDSAIVDPADVIEASRTIRCLEQPRLRLVLKVLQSLAHRPARLGRSLLTAVHAGWRSERGLMRHMAYLTEAAWLLSVLRDRQIEHLHVHFGTNAAVVARLARCLGGPPYSFTVHGPDEFDSPRSWQLTELQADAAFVVAITDYCSAQLRRWARPRDWSRIHIVRCGVNEHFFEQASAVREDCRTFVCVGRLCPQKGQLVLLDAMDRVRRWGHDCQLILGGDGDMRPIIEHRIQALGLSNEVHITGWIDEARVREVIRASRSLILPSFAEGLPVAIMEAMAMGRPVISTYVAGIPELVQGGENGWLVPAGNVDQLASAMVMALNAPADRLTRMGMVGADRVRHLHNTATEVERLESLLLSAVDRHG
jgi:glycosyltransferase involved in cell wall biosynthesis